MTLTDFEYSKQFHGDKINTTQVDLVNKFRTKDGELQKKALDEYLEKFEEQDAGIEARRSNYTTLVNNYYDLGSFLHPF
jgi:hypothetical protein